MGPILPKIVLFLKMWHLQQNKDFLVECTKELTYNFDVLFIVKLVQIILDNIHSYIFYYHRVWLYTHVSISMVTQLTN